MFEMLSNLLSPILGSRSSSLSIPTLDGALKPNNFLEHAPAVVESAGLEDVALHPDGDLYVADGNSVCQVRETGELKQVAGFERKVTALTFTRDGRLIAATGDTVHIDPGTEDVRSVTEAQGKRLVAVNSLSMDPDDGLLITDASATLPCSEWQRDLMEKGRTGRLARYSLSTGKCDILAAGLRYAGGSLVDGRGRVLVSESWRHQLTIVSQGKSIASTHALPAYPGRMTPAAGGGFWLSLFASRTQLVEFVLRENDYRREMIRTIDPKYWIAPALNSGEDFLEPLQGGSVKQMGILKPWAPPRSYGLVVRFNDDLLPIYSLHSRVGGRHHGIVATAQKGDSLFVLSKGAGKLLRLSIPEVEAELLQGLSK